MANAMDDNPHGRDDDGGGSSSCRVSGRVSGGASSTGAGVIDDGGRGDHGAAAEDAEHSENSDNNDGNGDNVPTGGSKRSSDNNSGDHERSSGEVSNSVPTISGNINEDDRSEPRITSTTDEEIKTESGTNNADPDAMSDGEGEQAQTVATVNAPDSDDQKAAMGDVSSDAESGEDEDQYTLRIKPKIHWKTRWQKETNRRLSTSRKPTTKSLQLRANIGKGDPGSAHQE